MARLCPSAHWTQCSWRAPQLSLSLSISVSSSTGPVRRGKKRAPSESCERSSDPDVRRSVPRRPTARLRPRDKRDDAIARRVNRKRVELVGLSARAADSIHAAADKCPATRSCAAPERESKVSEFQWRAEDSRRSCGARKQTRKRTRVRVRMRTRTRNHKFYQLPVGSLSLHLLIEQTQIAIVIIIRHFQVCAFDSLSNLIVGS